MTSQEDRVVGERVSDKACTSYRKFIDPLHYQILGGQYAEEGEFPHMVRQKSKIN
jgi:hypothetical protein